MSLQKRILTFFDAVLFDGEYEREIAWGGGVFIGLVLLLIVIDFLR